VLVTGDMFKQISSIGSFNKVGDKFKVTDISADGMITFSASYGMGMMSWKEFNEHFEKIECNHWGEWVENDEYVYKTNNKQVKVKKDGLIARSSCHPTDTFNLNKGISIALARIDVKKAEGKLATAIAM